MRRLDLVARAVTIAGFALLAATWVFTTPPGGFPDELGHYVRALSVGRGELIGAPLPPLPQDEVDAARVKQCCAVGNPTAHRWVWLGVREVDIPARLAPEALPCRELAPVGDTRCGAAPAPGSLLHGTTMGTIEPGPYLLPGLLARLADDPGSALLIMRVANAALAVGLLATATVALWPPASDRSALALGGLLVAVTPMVLFVAASPSPSSVEAAAGVAFLALLLRLVRDPAPEGAARRSVWWGLGVVGALLATSRSLGPVWILVDALVVAALAGVRPTWRRLRDGGRWAAGAVALVALATASTVLWEARYQPGIELDGSFFWDQVSPTYDRADDTLQQVVGAFGSLEITLPDSATSWWGGAGLLLAGAALAAGRWRERALLLVTAATVVAAVVVVSAALLRQNGFDVQGRHVLAVAAAAPLLAGEVAQRRRVGRSPLVAGAVLAAVAGTTAAVQVAAVRASGLRYGWLGDDRAPDGAWHPPGGPAPWVACAVAGALGLLVGPVLAAAVRARTPGAGDAAN